MTVVYNELDIWLWESCHWIIQISKYNHINLKYLLCLFIMWNKFEKVTFLWSINIFGQFDQKKLYLHRICMNIFLLHLFALTKNEEKCKYFQKANN